MEVALPISPTRQLIEDDDQYNTEKARLFFGPLKTPERRMSSIPDSTPSEHPGQASPSSAPANANSEIQPTMESSRVEDDADEALLAEELVQGMGEDEDDDDDDDDDDIGGDEMKDENMDFIPNDPSFMLAERISHATSNPSPPPSPLPPTNRFDDSATLELNLSSKESSEERESIVKEQTADAGAGEDILIRLDGAVGENTQEPPPMDLDPFIVSHNPPQELEFRSLEAPFHHMAENSGTDVSIPPIEQPTSVVSSTVSTIDALLDFDSTIPLDVNSEQHDAIEMQSETMQQEFDALSESKPKAFDEQETTAGVPGIRELTPSLASTPPLRRSPRRGVMPTSSQPTGLLAADLQPGSRPSKPRRQQPDDAEVVDDSQDEGKPVTIQQLSSQPLTPRGKERNRSKSPMIFNREVRSLSPDTANILSQLVPTLTDPTELQLSTSADDPKVFNPFAPSGPHFKVFSAPPENAPSTPKRPNILVHPAVTPKPLQGDPQSNVNATPARRITMEEAIEKGQISPLKAAQLGYTPRVQTSAAPQTPARRVLITDKSAAVPSSSRPALRFGSPVRAKSKEPEPIHEVRVLSGPRVDTGKPTPSSDRAGPSLPTKSTAGGRLVRLPFPLLPNKSAIAAQPPKNETDPRPGRSGFAQQQSPAKSTLKQTTSRIPRIGAKPYARPASAAKANNTATNPPSDKPVVARKVDLSKPSTNKMVIPSTVLPTPPAAPASDKGKGKAPAIPRVGTIARKPLSLEKPVPLKRKRGTEVAPTVKKVAVARSIPSVAKVATTKSTDAVKASISTTPNAVGPSGSRPQRKREPPVRALVRPALPTSVVAQDQTQEAEIQREDSGIPQPLGSPMQEEAQPHLMAPSTSTQTSVAHSSPPAQPRLPLPTIRIDPPHETPPIETLPPYVRVEVTTGVRRTGRLRKASQMADSGGEQIPRPAQSRRKAASQAFRFTFTDAFSEMSATALKNLTANNTTLNQAYLSVRLETEIIRKTGARPESPAVKIKTIAQREQEDKERKRMERAKRYARRSGGEVPGSSDVEPSSDDDELFGSLDGSDDEPRHQRGAGEDEDYETPHRAFKRMRLTENGPEEVGEEPKRRVKWDRGLYTTVYLDEVKLGSRQYPKGAVPQLKGCLAPAAKALPLDTLGNLPPAEVSVEAENVIVKKFVYDTDMPEPVPEPEEPPAKVTRSRSKKPKS
ncbi:hypothetical protein FA15DRAFT_663226 [Coprinopsis marcescibilis]|uniref:Uncharacterized protein n=1 Tax=Coprinopsis marcescibilis TaxID=230819 RepID=A0A5C3LMH1_COPMA|nr:hypothetical protein FA15DRAFT_663226 [Coprinopsis marcescibilis]